MKGIMFYLLKYNLLNIIIPVKLYLKINFIGVVYMYKKQKRKKKINNLNETILSKIANIFTIILSSVNIFYLCYNVNLNLYPETDKTLRKFNMIFIQIFWILLLYFFSFVAMSIIFRSIFMDRIKLKECKILVIFKTIFKFIVINVLFIEIFLGANFFETPSISIELIVLYFIISIIFTTIVMILSLKLILNPKIDNLKINNRFCKLIRFLSEYIGIKTISLLIIIFNILFIAFINIEWVRWRIYEDNFLIEKEYKKDQDVKFNLIVDKILDKLDIEITEEEIANERKYIIDKYTNKLEN